MAIDPAIRNHQAWIGYLQPDGLVVSAAALVDAQVFLDQNLLPLQQKFLPFVHGVQISDIETIAITDFTRFVREFLEWSVDCCVGPGEGNSLPDSLSVPLPEYGETLVPSFALRDPKPKDVTKPWLLLVKAIPLGEDLDAVATGKDAQWSASPSRRFERLLRETKIPIGVLTNGILIKLVYAPRGENSGSLTIPVHAMTEVAGRPILGALHMLLHRYRLFSAPSEARLPALLERSRAYQGRVSEELANQVLDSLYELLRGFQAGDERAKRELLREVLASRPNDVYGGLLTVLLRLVFLLYAEDRGIMPNSSIYAQNYSIHGLFERLRADYERYPDTIDQRYGAWSQLVALFRAVFNGCRHPQLKMPARKGFLFDPGRYPFLEGHSAVDGHVPLVSDGVLFRVLRNLLLLDGERLSYRTLDVEQIGSVYETMVGFRLEIASGPTIAVKAAKAKGAPTAINLDDLLGAKPENRAKLLREKGDQNLSNETAEALKTATNVDGLLAALERRIARNATPSVVPKGGMVLQPTDERRRSGSHYTPRSLTEPIVRKTLDPILKRLGEKPTPEQVLDLKIADIAVGSGAFLVETSRQLGEELVKAWHSHGRVLYIPPDEDEVLHARRLVAQRCLYGVDRNPMAVDLAKLSLWLATLAKEHPFTFLDHAIRCGDSLVGLTPRQMADCHWKPETARVLGQDELEQRVEKAARFRKEILEADELTSPVLKQEKLDKVDEALNHLRLVGDLVIAAFFAADKDRAKLSKRNEYLAQYVDFFKTYNQIKNVQRLVDELRSEPCPVLPFHWEIEFPEVFQRENGGFDGILGNPPFMGGKKITTVDGDAYLAWLKVLHEDTDGNADLVAHFFRRAFSLLRNGGCLGLIATNTIGQGDTRFTGLRWICTHGGTTYAARRRYRWPGQAAVVVSIVWIMKGDCGGPFNLDNHVVPSISAYLFHAGGHDNPHILRSNGGRSFIGCFVMDLAGFTFDDAHRKGKTATIAEMRRLISKDGRNAQRIFPYLGGEELNDSPTQSCQRYVINFSDLPLRRESCGGSWLSADEDQRRYWLRSGIVPLDYPEPVAADWPDLLKILEEKVKPERAKKAEEVRNFPWWRYWRLRGELATASQGLTRLIALSRIGQHMTFAFVPAGIVFSDSLVLVTTESDSLFCTLQSRVHEIWARFFSSSMKDDLRYTPSDCFETFPFQRQCEEDQKLQKIGREYNDFRAALMIRNNEGLTKTHNRFHDPEENSSGILRLRELHDSMDRVVLDAYGWTDIKPTCEFILDYEEEEDADEGRTRRKPWRYRWPDDIRDEVLARLLALNKERAKAETLAESAIDGGKKLPKASKRKREVDPGQSALRFDVGKTNG